MGQLTAMALEKRLAKRTYILETYRDRLRAIDMSTILIESILRDTTFLQELTKRKWEDLALLFRHQLYGGRLNRYCRLDGARADLPVLVSLAVSAGLAV